MSIREELEKVFGLTSMATSDQAGVIAGLLAEFKSLEDHVLAIGQKVGIDKPEVAIPVAPAADTPEQSSTSEAESQSVGASEAQSEEVQAQ